MKEWQKMMENSIRDIRKLKDILHFGEDETEKLQKIAERYPVCVNSYYLGLIDSESKQDPIRKMSIPDFLEFSEGGSADTSGESENTVIQGMQHKYRQTVLILSTNVCAMYCRHCFRKRMVGLSSEETAVHIPKMAEYVRSHPEINNVLISGGDAFMNSNEIIEEYLKTFSEIPSLDYIRIGTRTPVTLPQRITEDDGELLDVLRRWSKKKTLIIVTQFNHPREITEEAKKAVELLCESGCIVRNQTVLLKGVNDRPEILAQLMNQLVAAKVLPYYVFQCRPVEGVKNQFQVPFKQGVDIVDQAKASMNGQSKAFRYVMSHPTGKIEILGKWGDRMLFKYHQAKYDADQGRMFEKQIEDDQCWLDEI